MQNISYPGNYTIKWSIRSAVAIMHIICKRTSHKHNYSKVTNHWKRAEVVVNEKLLVIVCNFAHPRGSWNGKQSDKEHKCIEQCNIIVKCSLKITLSYHNFFLIKKIKEIAQICTNTLSLLQIYKYLKNRDNFY